MAGTPPERRAGTDRMIVIGAVLVGLGCVATAVTLLPLVVDAEPLSVAWYLLCFLAPLGFAMILVALWRRARGRRERLRAAHTARASGIRPT